MRADCLQIGGITPAVSICIYDGLLYNHNYTRVCFLRLPLLLVLRVQWLTSLARCLQIAVACLFGHDRVDIAQSVNDTTPTITMEMPG